MKVLHIIHRYYPFIGGSENYMREISERLVQEGHIVDVYTTDAWDMDYFWHRKKRRISKRYEILNGVEIKRFPVRHYPLERYVKYIMRKLPFQDCKYLFSYASPFVPDLLMKCLCNSRYDIVHATAFPYDFLLYIGLKIAKRRSIPCVFTPLIHLGEPANNDVRRLFVMDHQIRLLKESDMIFVQTKREMEEMVSLGIPSEKLCVSGMAVEPKRIIGGNGERFRKKYGIGSPIVCQISAQSYDKGSFHLVEAMNLLWRKGWDIKLVMVGPVIEDFKKYLETQKRDFLKNCLILGFIDEEEKKDLLSASDVVVMASRAESFGIVYLEAWLYQKPVIGAYAGVMQEIIKDGEDGFLVPFGDYYTLAEYIAALLEDKEMSNNMGKAGERKVRNYFTWDVKYPIIRHSYEELTSR